MCGTPFSALMLVFLVSLFLVSFAPFTTGAASFSPLNQTATAYIGQNAHLIWNYTVGDKNFEFSSNSPTWEFFETNSSTWLQIAIEVGPSWEWRIANDCPPRLRTRLSKFETFNAALVISNVSEGDAGRYRCNLEFKFSATKVREIELTVEEAPTIATTPPTSTAEPNKTTTATPPTATTTPPTVTPPPCECCTWFWIGVVLIVIGLVIIIMDYFYHRRVIKKRGESDTGNQGGQSGQSDGQNDLPLRNADNPGENVSREPKGYSTKVKVFFLLGVLLIVCGLIAIIVCVSNCSCICCA